MGETKEEFRAGLLLPSEGKLKADPRKGLLRVIVSAEDQLLHVQWYERVGLVPKEEPERDIIVFPGECSLRELPNQARCYSLTFPEDPSRNEFYWLQEPSAENDAPLVLNFNSAVNDEKVSQSDVGSLIPGQQEGREHHPPPPAQAEAGPSSTGAAPKDLAALLGAALASATAPASSAPAAWKEDTLMALLAQAADKPGAKRVHVDQGPRLEEVLQPEVLVPLLQAPQALQALAEHLPEDHRSMEQLIATVQSPQFRQQVALFGAAIQTGQLDTLHQFGLQTKGFSTADFLEAIQEQVNKEKARAAEGSGPSKMEH